MAFSKINLASHITGTLPVANGGTALTSGFVNGGSLTPSFSAYLNSSDQSIASDTYVKIIFNGEDHDTNSAYDTSNGRFTVPSGEGGRYVFGYMGSYDNASADSVPWSTFVWYKNGSAQTSYLTADYSSTSRRGASVCDVITITLSASDYIEIYAYHNKGSAADLQPGQFKNHFWGYKIG